MGLEWLESVVQVLTQAGFRAESGYPAGRVMCLWGTVAAVNLTGLDGARGTVKLTVTILTPRQDGLAQCQAKAAQVVELLTADRQAWSFSGWQYDNGIDCYSIEVNGVQEPAQEPEPVSEPEPEPEPEGYQVLIGEKVQEYVTDFLAQQKMDRRLIRPHGQPEPCSVIPGMDGWTIRLTQLIPPEAAEPVQPGEPFTLTVRRGGHTQVYPKCYWSDYSARQQKEGTEVIRSGFALSREVN